MFRLPGWNPPVRRSRSVKLDSNPLTSEPLCWYRCSIFRKVPPRISRTGRKSTRLLFWETSNTARSASSMIMALSRSLE